MKTRSFITALTFLVIFHLQSFAQNANSNPAKELGRQAIQKMNEGNPDEAIQLLKQADSLDPEHSFDYRYEIGFAYLMKKDNKRAIEIYKGLLTDKKVSDQVFMMLGNAYDENGQEKTALATYAEGLKKFPHSGRLLMEIGNVCFKNRDYNKALRYYEIGIENEPEFASNYYRAARIFLSSDEEVWGMLYGELFMNIERNSERTRDVSNWLYKTYRDQIKKNTDSSWSVSFTKNNAIEVSQDKLKKRELKPPFPLVAYEPVTLMSLPLEDTLNLETLCQLRTNFLDNYFKMHLQEKYPNILFEYQLKVKNAGHLNAYNHWVLLNGDELAFMKWQKNHQKEWDDFVDWFLDNRMVVNSGNLFYRSQY